MAKGLNSGAFTGDASKGNPYQGDMGKGIDYDTYEAGSSIIEQIRDYPQILKPYQAGAKGLIKYFSAQPHDRTLDLGSGTGIATLELLSQYPKITVLGLEESEGMLEIARYKFHQINGKKLLSQIDNQRLLDYWDEFRKESKPYKNQVNFVLGDIQTTNIITQESIDNTIANQVMHWTDLSVSFKQLNRFLKTKGQIIWNSASHFYNDSQFPSEKYGFRYNDFLGFVMDEVAKKVNVKDYRALSLTKQNLDSIKEITKQQGFETNQVATYLEPVDLQTFITNHIPVFVKTLITSDITDKEKERLAKQAIAKTITNPKALKDTTHKYDIVPVFKSVKINKTL